MTLTRVPGLTPEEAGRLADAGVADVPALAHHADLPGLAARAGIPETRLVTLHAAALDLEEGSGISIHTPFQEMAQTVVRAADDARADLTRHLRTAEAVARARAADAVHALEHRLAALRAALIATR